MSKIKKIYLDLCMSSVFNRLLNKPLFLLFADYVNAKEDDERIKAYSSMVSEIYKNGGALTDAVRTLIFEDENPYVILRSQEKEISSSILGAVKHELDAFSSFASLTAEDFAQDMQIDFVSPFDSEKCNLLVEYEERMRNIANYGYGIFASNSMLRPNGEGVLTPVISADKTTLDSFIGYENERLAVIENTLKFIEGKPAANVLLCGDAGTGKSSTVKAIVNEYFDRGLRLIELRKDQLSILPEIMGKIVDNPLKFIIFIDDLSFNKNDDNFSMLKAALEGSASAKSDNALIYATSNRRHIVKETFDDREGEDVHRNDTMQEKLSLSERFGLVVLFQKPNKQLYLDIVHRLAERYYISMDKTAMDIKAEEFALRRGNRSARCAEQFIKSLI